MKKIIALALCLIMALSLCTVAFAGSSSTESKGRTVSTVEGYYVRPLDSNDTKGTIEKYADAGWVKTTIDGETTTQWAVPYYTVADDSKVAWGEKLYVCDESIADYRIFNASGFVCYAIALFEDLTKVDEGVYVAKGTSCMDYVDNTVEIGDVSRVVVESYNLGEKFAYVDGKLFIVGGVSKVNMHKFDIADVTFKGVDKDGHKVPVSVKCDKCDKTFQIISGTKLAAYEGKYEIIHRDSALDAGKCVYAVFSGFADYAGVEPGELKDMYNTYYVLLGVDGKTVTTTTATSDGVESAKTFDAGIAMYVGMSLSAVAGSAVVIGKKKEF